MIFITKNGRKVAHSRNLRGILSYLRKSGGAEKVRLWRKSDGSGSYHVLFADGAETYGDFASYAVMRRWFHARGGRSGWIPREAVVERDRRRSRRSSRSRRRRRRW